ncbi:GH25 family lysozyme [Leuconostoc suionicum]|uniref:GH25 family lysozyme n=1 Tax=Leuconostoc suionicum TaxID=1511761 RepID=UPI0024ADD471|nr:GH25 family lysozyme [Leuconostoc suionicum]MDI6498673.1 GH25 family lysozyme [Leuconostoc suionicum]MDI6500715.1 GH25 family lysozyme [Leuconostoc suionicum]MDI6502839.1 GH25 family lysozyme [Leuconostoc suionicum]MDI6521965.1 GH25 family lysozyme [Leuconostoc suionicum]MDI6550643.1 GH25 family lysozyme [Leuconostoc suionicum]
MNKITFWSSIVVAGIAASLIAVNQVHADDGVPAITAGTSGLPRMDVVDVSSNNGTISVADYKKMQEYGVKAVIVKLSEADSYKNPYAKVQIANAKEAGLKVGAYHYSWYASTADAQAEAKYFTDYATSLNLPKDTLMVDDLEETYTKNNSVTVNATAFSTQVKAAGYKNTSTYTYVSYVNETQLNFSYIGNNRVWIAQYPYQPSDSGLWNNGYGMWQWNSNTSFPGISGTFDVSIDYKNLISVNSNGYNDGIFYQNNTPANGYYNDGTGYKWFENGQLYTGFRNYMGTYYFFENGMRQDNKWETAWGMKYYVGSDGRAVQGVQVIDGNKYYFGNNTTFYLRTNTTIQSGNTILKANDSGVLEPWTGYIYDGSAYNGGYRWYENGQLFTGFRYYTGTYYWFENGVRQNAGWRYAWNYTYWTNNEGRAVQGHQTIDGKDYYFGDDGTYYKR